MNRITNTDKWKDDWFLSLKASAKLLFIYLYENCDDAGFISLNSKFMATQIGMTPIKVVEAIKLLDKAIIMDSTDGKKGKKAWIKNFLFYQQQLPLEDGNSDHKKIKLILEKNLPLFNDNKDIGEILSKIENPTQSKRKGVSKFVKPSLEDFKEFGFQEANEKQITITEDWVEGLFNHYESNGWKVGGKTPMKDWKAAMRNGINREKSRNKSNGGKIDKLRNANDGYNDVKVV